MSDTVIVSKAVAAGANGDAPAAHVTPAMGLAVVAAVVVVLGIFVALLAALGVGDLWVSFLFLLYWSGFERGKFEKLPGSVVGAVVGLAMAWGLQVLPASMGTAGAVIIGAAILVSVYCLIVGWLPLVVNYSTMLFLTVGTLPVVQATTAFPTLLRPLGFGVIYFAGVAWLVQLFVQRSAAKQKMT
jgi:hypothetical protein